MNTKVHRLSAINYFGGKSRYMDWLLPFFDRKHINDLQQITHWVEPFCGAASVTLNIHPYPIETINDIDGRLVNFFQVLRDHPEKLIDKLLLTPYNRAEFIMSLKPHKDKIEDARRFFVRMQQSFGGIGHVSARITSWRTQYVESRRGMSMETSKYLSKIEGLHEVAARIMTMQIDNRDFRDVFKFYNSPNIIKYCDPPYVHVSRTGKKDYAYEMTDDEHIEFLELANLDKGKMAISGYDSELYNDMLLPVEKGGQWYKHLGPDRITNIGKNRKTAKREILWTNYNVNNQVPMLVL